MEPQNAQEHYSEKLVRLPNIGVCYEKPELPRERKARSDYGISDDATVYLCSQSFSKYLPQYDDVFPRIAKRVPRAWFVFLSPNPEVALLFEGRLKRAFAKFSLESEDYCKVLPYQDHVSYMNLNLVSDVFLDTIGWSGGITALDAVACGLPPVTLPGEFMRGRQTYGILRMLGVQETVAKDEADYIQKAVDLGLDAGKRNALKQKIMSLHSRLFGDKECVLALDEFYRTVVTQHLSQ
jgi:predicted O-linked N-acetylglucosamine transferase (SPINDLY family)